MKILAGILAIYILGITLIPCDDIHFINDNSSDFSNLLTQQQDDDHDTDHCSPFCACDCCSTVAEVIDMEISQIETQPLFAVEFPCFVTDKETVRPFWRPPIVRC